MVCLHASNVPLCWRAIALLADRVVGVDLLCAYCRSLKSATGARGAALELMCTLYVALHTSGTTEASSHQGSGTVAVGRVTKPRAVAVTLHSLLSQCEDVVSNGTPPTAKRPYNSAGYNMPALSGLVTLLPLLQVGGQCGTSMRLRAALTRHSLQKLVDLFSNWNAALCVEAGL